VINIHLRIKFDIYIIIKLIIVFLNVHYTLYSFVFIK